MPRRPNRLGPARNKRSRTSKDLHDEDSLVGCIHHHLHGFFPLAKRLRVGIGDDAAVWQPRPGCETVLTCDWFLQGSHFLLERHPPHAIGWKCLSRAVSDLAAVGAEPRCFLLSLALPPAQTGLWLDEFLRGLRSASQKLNCVAAGGDTTRRSEVLINVTVVGECPAGRAVLRGGAKPGDIIFASGKLGEAEYGLRLLCKKHRRLNLRDRHLRKHLYPQPRLAVAFWVASRQLATAMMDLSDGLSSDLPRLCAASKVGAQIRETLLPRVKLAERDRAQFDPLSLALHGGDDYELLFTVAARNAARIPRRIGGVPITRIGEITSARNIVLFDRNQGRKPLAKQGWDPFRS